MKTINWKISLGFLKRNSIQQHIGIAFVRILSFALTNCQNATNQEKDRQEKVALAQILNSDSNESKPSKIEDFSQRLLDLDKKNANKNSRSTSDVQEAILDFVVENVSQAEWDKSLNYLQSKGVIQPGEKPEISIHSPTFKEEVKEKLFSKDYSSLQSDFISSWPGQQPQSKFWQTHCFWGIYCKPMNWYMGQDFWPAALMCAAGSFWTGQPTWLEYKHTC